MTTLIKMAFQNLPGGKGSMADIYAWITKEYPYYSKMKVGKCNSLIRATLYNTKCFRRTKKDKKVWKIDSNYDTQNLQNEPYLSEIKKNKAEQAIKAHHKFKKKSKNSKKCPTCQKVFRWRNNLRRHLEKKSCRVNTSKPLSKSKVRTKKRNPENFPKVWGEPWGYDSENENEQSIRQMCEFCKRILSTNWNKKLVWQHERRCRKFHKFIINGKKCKFCYKSNFRTYSWLLAHLEQKHGDEVEEAIALAQVEELENEEKNKLDRDNDSEFVPASDIDTNSDQEINQVDDQDIEESAEQVENFEKERKNLKRRRNSSKKYNDDSDYVPEEAGQPQGGKIEMERKNIKRRRNSSKKYNDDSDYVPDDISTKSDHEIGENEDDQDVINEEEHSNSSDDFQEPWKSYNMSPEKYTEQKQNKKTKSFNKNYKCKSCQETFHLLIELNNHKKICFDTKDFNSGPTCKYCQTSISKNEIISYHEELCLKYIDVVHKNNHCKLCQRSFDSKTNAYQHVYFSHFFKKPILKLNRLTSQEIENEIGEF